MGIFECIMLFLTYISLSEINFLIRISAKKSLAINKNPLYHFNPFEKSSVWTVNHQVIHIFTQYKLILRLKLFIYVFVYFCTVMEGENQELKAGHPPAQKVGGMRIVQQKKPEKHEGSPPKVSGEDEKEDDGDEKVVKATPVI